MSVLVSSEAEVEYEFGRKLIGSDPANALAHLARALASGCKDLDLFVELSALLIQFRKYEEASKVCLLGLRSFPSNTTLLGHQGVACAQLGAFQQALELFHRQADLLEDNQRPWGNIGNMLLWLGRLDEAISVYRTGLRHNPNDRFSLASALLLRGDFLEGFREMEGRPSLKRGSLPGPAFWDGSGDTPTPLVLYCEQGIGDAIQCARYIGELNRRGIEPVFELPANTYRLFSGLPGRYTLRVDKEKATSAAAQAAIFSLPHFLGTDLHSIPKPIPFVIPETLKLEWQRRLELPPGLRVAVAWAGNPGHGNDHNRSIPLELFRGILDCPNVIFLSVQMGAQSARIAELVLHHRVRDLSPLITDFADTAAILSQMDLVISVDTSVAHLAGNQGIPVWNLIPYAPDWRWMLNRDDSPWYPSMRLFRQPQPCDWPSVIAQVASALPVFKRARQAAALVPAGASVLDLHAGAQDLARCLPPGCTYQSCNISEQELPPSTDATVVTLLGVLDQVDAWRSLLQYLRNLNRMLIFSYRLADGMTVEEQQSLGCVNHLSLAELAATLAQLNFCIRASQAVDGREALFVIEPA